MSIRGKTLVILLVVITTLIIILYATSQLVLLHSFQQLEAKEITQNVHRATNTVDDALTSLAASARDYARWDEAYDFVQGRNPDFPNINLPDNVFVNLRLNLVAFVNKDGKTVFIKAVDLQSGAARELPAGIETHLKPSSLLLNHPDVDSSQSGILLLSEGPMLVASQSVTDSFAQQPVAGSLIFGAFLDDARIQQFSDSLRLPIVTRLVSDPQLPDDYKTAAAVLGENTSTYVLPLSTNRIAGYALENDIYGQPALLLRVDVPRDIFATGQASINLFLALQVIAGVILGLLTVFLNERFVLSRLMHLSADVNEISTGGSLAGRVSLSGNDELSTLAADINSMLETLDKAQIRLHESDQRLRSIVQSAPLMLWSVDTDGKLTLLEGKSLTILGLDAAQTVSKPAAQVFRNMPQVLTETNRALNGENFTSIVIVKDSTFDTRYMPVRGLNGVITGMIGVATNITERMIVEEALSIAYRDLSRQNQQLERVQELFRATLEQIAETLRRGANQEEVTQYIEFVQAEFNRVG